MEWSWQSVIDALGDGVGLVEMVPDDDDDAGRPAALRLLGANPVLVTRLGLGAGEDGEVQSGALEQAIGPAWQAAAVCALATGDPVRFPVTGGCATGDPCEARVRVVGDPAHGRMVLSLHDVAGRDRSGMSLWEGEECQRFLLELNDELRTLADPADVMRVAARMLARWMGVSAVGYAIIGDDGETIRTGGEYGDGRMPSLEGFSGRLSDFGHGLGPALRAGESVFTGDIRNADDWTPGGSGAATERDLGAAAMIPLRRDDRLVACLYAADPAPRAWSEAERSVMRAVADRTWAAVQMAHTHSVLRANEERFRALTEHVSDGIQVVDAEGIIRYSSDSIVSLLGYRPEEMNGTVFGELLHPDDRAMVMGWISDLATRPGAVSSLECRVMHRDGRVVWMETTVTNHFATPSIGGLVGNFHDVTDRRRTDEALRAGEVRYRALFESMGQGFCTIEMLFDPDGVPIDYTFLEINAAFERNTGLINAAGRRMREFAPDHEQRWFDVYGAVAMTGQPIRFEQEAAALDRWFSLYAYRVGRPEQRRVAVLFEDITARKRTEQDHERARQVAERAVVARDRFLSIGAHELRTPITGIRGSAELLLRSVRRGSLDPARLERYAGNLLESTDQMAALVNDLFDVSRLQSSETGQLGARTQLTDLAELIRTTLRAPHLDRARHRLAIDLAAGPAVEVDPDRIRQVIVNLVDNALKYSPEGGQVMVGLSQDGTGTTLRVRDSGIGLPAVALETVFEPFNRASNAAASNIPGMGLGLYICREIAQAHRGRLWAESEGEGTGTTMTLWLPAAG